MQCPYCGNQNRPGVKFCARCGKPLPQQPVAAPSPAYQPPPAPPPAAVPPAYQPPPAPPSPVPVPPPSPVAQPPVSPAGTAARRIPWRNIAIGCGIYVLGMLCGMLILAGVVYSGIIPTPTPSPSPALQTPSQSPSPTTPPPQPTPSQKPGTPATPKPSVWIEPGLGSIRLETVNVSGNEFPGVYTNTRERFLI
jgi:hypothetical protein